MSTEIDETQELIDESLNELVRLREWNGTPRELWSRYADALGRLTLASKLVLLVRDPNNGGGWRKVSEWTSQTDALSPQEFLPEARQHEIADAATRDYSLCERIEGEDGDAGEHFVLGVALHLAQGAEECVAVLLLRHTDLAEAREALARARLASDVPAMFQLRQAKENAQGDAKKFATVLDTIMVLQREERFLAAALALCNELATRYQCDRISLGWLHHGYLRLQAVSRMEHFDRQMEAAQSLEATMEEAFDQDEEIVWPPPEKHGLILRDHEKYAKEQGVNYLCSVPIRHDEQPVAVLTAERNASAWKDDEVRQLRLVGDLVARPLTELKAQDRWFGARWATAVRKSAGKLVGPEHTWAKLLTLTIAGLLAVLIFVPVPYRVEADAVVKSDETASLTAPFQGYIEDVAVEPGDEVDQGETLAELDTEQLRLRESSAVADLNQYRRRAEQARAEGALAQMRVAQAQAAQAQSQLDIVRHRLEQASIRAPFTGVVVESDLKERIGSPVQQGDELIKIARTDHLYVEAEVNERDVHELNGNEAGKLAFVSRPQEKFSIQLQRVEPAAVARDQKNIFVARCEFDQPPEHWWRPGMEGLCKLDVGNRRLLWIFTERTVDFLRMKFWW